MDRLAGVYQVIPFYALRLEQGVETAIPLERSIVCDQQLILDNS